MRVSITVVLASVVGWGLVSDAPTDDERLAALADRVACPVCDGSSSADSQSLYARNIRSFIATEIENGATDREILDGFIASFGEDIVLDPPIGRWVWLAPFVAVGIGAAVVRSLRRPAHNIDVTADVARSAPEADAP